MMEFELESLNIENSALAELQARVLELENKVKTLTDAIESKEKRKCNFCTKDHKSEECPLSKPERLTIVNKKGYCLKCARDHRNNCFKPKICRTCRLRKYCFLICPC